MEFSKSKEAARNGGGVSSPLQASIVGSCLLSFSSDVLAQDQQDIQDCFTYAELAANNRYLDQADTKDWFNYYQGRLLKAGFKQKTFVPNTPISVGSSHELSNAAFDIIGDVGSKQMGRLVRQSYKALRMDDVAWDYFRGNVVKSGLTTARFSPCEYLATGEIAVFLLGLRYKTTVFEEDFFFWTDFDRQLTLIPDGGVFLFNRDVFAEYREGVHQKIDRYSEKIIVERLKG